MLIICNFSYNTMAANSKAVPQGLSSFSFQATVTAVHIMIISSNLLPSMIELHRTVLIEEDLERPRVLEEICWMNRLILQIRGLSLIHYPLCRGFRRVRLNF